MKTVAFPYGKEHLTHDFNENELVATLEIKEYKPS